MARPDLKMIGLALESLQRLKELMGKCLHRSFLASGALQKIWTSDIADKNEIARQGTHRLVTALEVGNEKSHVLWGVARRVLGAHEHSTDLEATTVAQNTGLPE